MEEVLGMGLGWSIEEEEEEEEEEERREMGRYGMRLWGGDGEVGIAVMTSMVCREECDFHAQPGRRLW